MDGQDGGLAGPEQRDPIGVQHSHPSFRASSGPWGPELTLLLVALGLPDPARLPTFGEWRGRQDQDWEHTSD